MRHYASAFFVALVVGGASGALVTTWVSPTEKTDQSRHHATTCPEDSIRYVTGAGAECVHLESMTPASRTSAEQWLVYCGTAFDDHRRPVMRFDRVGRLTLVRCARGER